MKTITLSEALCPKCDLPLIGDGENCWHCSISEYRPKTREIGIDNPLPGLPIVGLTVLAVIGLALTIFYLVVRL